MQVPDELNQAIDTQTEEQGDPTEQQGESTSALLAAYALGRASMTTDAKRRKSECAKIRMPCKTGVFSMLWTAANNGTIAALDEKQKESTTVQAAAAANHSKTAATDDRSKPSIDAIYFHWQKLGLQLVFAFMSTAARPDLIRYFHV